MPPYDLASALGRVQPILGALKTVPIPVHPQQDTAPSGFPFITISRQAGAGGLTLAQMLLERLRQRDEGEPPWSTWDRELIEKVAADLHTSTQLVESLQASSRSWLQQLLGGLSAHDVDDMAVFRRTASAIRAMAQVGRTIIVGRGAVFITQHMALGIHVRLVAPLEHRIARMMQERDWTREQATDFVRQTEAQRERFYKRYFPRHSMSPESFTLTINTGKVGDNEAADCVLALVSATPDRRQP